MDNMSVLEGLKAEQDFFNEHPIYSNKRYKDNIGIPALCRNLSDVLVRALKKSLPGILEKIDRDLESNKSQLDKLGTPIPDEDTLKSAFIHKTIAKLTRNFISILEDRGKIINTGRNIKQHFIDFRTKITNLEPFSKDKCSDNYILDAISNCEGNHMSFPSPPVEVLEQLMKDPIKRPIFLINEIAQKTSQKIMNELQELIDNLLEELSINRFPEFNKLLSKTCINQVFLPYLGETYKQIETELLSQENYIWTEDIQFNEALGESNSNSVEIMRNLANNYFRSTIYILQDTIPKKIMYTLVYQSQKDIGTKMYESVKETQMTELLLEEPDIHEKRNNLKSVVADLNNAKNLIESIM